MKHFFHRLASFWILLITGCLYSGFALASATKLTFTPPATDISMGYLEKLFGTVGNVLSGPGATILSVIFRDFNFGLFAVAGMLISYTTIRAVVDTAHDGEPMGKKMSHWIVIRSAIAIGLLVPTTPGYTALQGGIMWMTVQGIGLADVIWKDTLNYLRAGGVIFEGISNDKSSETISPKFVYGGDGSDPTSTTVDNYSGSLGVLRAQVCMRVISQAIKNSQQKIRQDMQDNPQNYTVAQVADIKDNVLNTLTPLSWSIDEKTGVATFPGKLTGDLSVLNGACGTFRWKWDAGYIPAKKQGKRISNDDNYSQDKLAGVQTMYSDLQPVADHMMTTDFSNYNGAQAQYAKLLQANPNVANTSISAGTAYQAAISQDRKARGNGILPAYFGRIMNSEFQHFYKDSIEKGWAVAGEYYYNLIKTQQKAGGMDEKFDKIWTSQDSYQTKVKAIPAPNANYKGGGSTTTTNQSFKTLEKTFKNLHDKYKGFDQNLLTTELKHRLLWINQLATNNIVGQIKKMNKVLATSGGKLKGVDLKIFSKADGDSGDRLISAPKAGMYHMGAWTVLKPLNNKLQNVLDTWHSVMIDSKYKDGDNTITVNSPVEKLYYFGQSMIGNAISCWQDIASNIYNMAIAFQAANAAGAVIIAAAAPGSFWGTTSGYIEAGKAGIAMVVEFMFKLFEMSVSSMMPLAMALTGIMFTMGVTLGFYVPLIPYMLFTFGIISWLLFVIEAMAAAALVALGLMDPRANADDVWGRAEPAQMLLFSVFLRPSLLLIGIIAGTVLSYVGVGILNLTFSGIMSAVHLSGGGGSSVTDLVKDAGIIIVYTLIMMSVVVKCYECIYAIPDQIMQWLGANTRPSDAMQLMNEVKQGLSQTASEGAAGGKGMAEKGLGHAQLSARQPGMKAAETSEAPLKAEGE